MFHDLPQVTFKGISDHAFTLIRQSVLTEIEPLDAEQLEGIFDDDPTSEKRFAENPMDPDFTETYQRFTGIYRDMETHNTLIMEAMYMADELKEDGKTEDTIQPSEILDALMEDPYQYLLKVLKKEKNVTVYISEVFGTTTDYEIYHQDWAIESGLPSAANNDKMECCKYQEWDAKSGFKKIEF